VSGRSDTERPGRRTSNIEIVHYCQTVFGCQLPSALLQKRYEKVVEKLTCTSV